ncbi:MAG TPA: glycoside hydrolase family 44 protein [Candidatus Limnocylindrales bacterium]|nr:glycoside hydrolase family 44 protein [Candidatus Limnocylindrales bacterium]
MRLLVRFGFFGFFLSATATFPVFSQTDQTIYTDSRQNSWQDWGWATTINYANTNPVHSGSESISVTLGNPWEAIYFAHTAFDSTPYTNLTFWINAGPNGGQQLLVQGHAGGNYQTSVNLAPLAANTWQKISISLAALGVANRPDMDGFWIQDRLGAAQPVFYVDDITLVAGTNSPPPATNTPSVITIDAQLNRHTISPLIYGVAFASSNQLADLNFAVNRSGGNSETRYNWQLNAHNHAADWYFESLADSPATPGAAADDFVANSKNAGAEPILTIPMIGWVPKLGPSRGHLASYSVAKYGAQTGIDPYWSDAGSGVSSGNQLPITNDPNDANLQTNSNFQAAWIQHLTNRWKLSSSGGVRYYCMDNEHSIWFSTHRDIQPVGPTMQEIRDRFFDYAGRVKALDPSALVLAPEEWGWSGYFYSGYDQQYGSQHGWSSLPDRANNANWDYLPWLLDQFRQRATNTNQRLLDYFTVHYYPQGGEFGNDVSSAMQLLRNRSTRSLWDTNYIDATWINSVVQLIPRLKGWVGKYYPGTKTGITEYNWGAESSINGATAQADILGIFGREGLDLATRWTTPAPTTPTYKAMKMFRNYDGNKSTFGETSINAAGPNPDNISVFAAQRTSDNAITVIVINKQLTASAATSLVFTNCQLTGTAQAWQLTSANSILRISDINFSGNKFSNSVPPQSITLYVLPTAGVATAPALRPGTVNSTNTFDLWLNGQSGQRYRLLSSTDLITWTPIATNTLSSASWHLILPATNTPRIYYRGQLWP